VVQAPDELLDGDGPLGRRVRCRRDAVHRPQLQHAQQIVQPGASLLLPAEGLGELGLLAGQPPVLRIQPVPLLGNGRQLLLDFAGAAVGLLGPGLAFDGLLLGLLGLRAQRGVGVLGLGELGFHGRHGQLHLVHFGTGGLFRFGQLFHPRLGLGERLRDLLQLRTQLLLAIEALLELVADAQQVPVRLRQGALGALGDDHVPGRAENRRHQHSHHHRFYLRRNSQTHDPMPSELSRGPAPDPHAGSRRRTPTQYRYPYRQRRGRP